MRRKQVLSSGALGAVQPSQKLCLLIGRYGQELTPQGVHPVIFYAVFPLITSKR